MTGQFEVAEQFRKIGWVQRAEAAEIIGRRDGSNVDAVLQKHGVRFLESPGVNGGRAFRVYLESDLCKVPRITEHVQSTSCDAIPGGESNGGKLAQRMKVIEASLANAMARIAELEKFKSDLEG